MIREEHVLKNGLCMKRLLKSIIYIDMIYLEFICIYALVLLQPEYINWSSSLFDDTFERS